MKRILAQRSVLGAFGATVVVLGLLIAWTKELRPAWVVAAATVHVVATLLLLRALPRLPRPISAQLAGALGLALVGVMAATGLTWRFAQLETDWPRLVAAHEARLIDVLEARMSRVVEQGRAAAAEVAALPRTRDRAQRLAQLERVRALTGVDALAILNEHGELTAWSGVHRGLLPEPLRAGGARPYFEERPLFSYLYFPHALPEGPGVAVAAILVETGLAAETAETSFSDVFGVQSGARATFRQGGGVGAVWSLVADGDTVAHARLDPLTQAEWRRSLNMMARRLVLLAVVAGFVMLCVAWLRWTGPARARWAAALPLVLTIPLIAGSPLRGALGADRIFSPVLFTLPLPLGDVSLGRLVGVLLPIAALLAGLRRWQLTDRLATAWLAGGALALALSYPLIIDLLIAGSTPALLHGGGAYWLGLQFAATIALTCITVLALPRFAEAAGPPADRRSRRGLAALGIGAAAVLGVAAAAPVLPGEPLRTWLAALWLLPFVPLALATARLSGRAGALTRWLAAGWLAGTAVLPQLWAAHVQARLAAAEAELATLGTESDTFRDYLLVTFGQEALARFAAGEDGVLLLYRTWVASGLAQEPYPARVIHWSPEGLPTVQLGSAPLPSEAETQWLIDVVQEAGGQPITSLAPVTAPPSGSRVLFVPLADGSLITVLVPPRRTLGGISSIAPFLGTVRPAATRLHLIEADASAGSAGPITWEPHVEGWRSETLVKYPDVWYRAHLHVEVQPVAIRLARATLLLTFDLAGLTLLWVLGVIGRGGTAVPRGDWTAWLGSFRARVTVALFGFFLIPTAVFGWVAYRALAGEVARAAEIVAQHSAAQAVAEFEDAGGDLRELAAHAGSDVLRYLGGELIGVSSREALDLGVYSAWMPPDVYVLLESGEEREALREQTLGNHSFVTAFHSLRAAGTLGVPMSLATGDAVVRQQQFAHLVLFAAVIGALLSLALSLAVGRALARPIGRLRRAALAVGAGRLRVRLPETAGDEFGELNAAFNRMVRQLRRARTREVRSARVLAWGEMARQVAHEIKNPLTPIKLAVQHLRRTHRDRHPQFEEILDTNVTQILSEIDRLSEIARAFSRYGAPAAAAGPLAAVNVAGVVREVLTLYRSGDRDVAYTDELDAALPPVQARPDELKEVLINLIENSRAALENGGRIIVTGTVADRDSVEVAVLDNGRGIPEELLPRVFEPHFSTRSAGTGLGLAIVRRLVESWGGAVAADSVIDVGTTVRLRLRRADTA